MIRAPHYYPYAAIGTFEVDEQHRRNGQSNLELVDLIVESFAEVGQMVPIVITPDGKLVDGYHRLIAARCCDWDSIQAIVIPATSQLTHQSEGENHAQK